MEDKLRKFTRAGNVTAWSSIAIGVTLLAVAAFHSMPWQQSSNPVLVLIAYVIGFCFLGLALVGDALSTRAEEALGKNWPRDSYWESMTWQERWDQLFLAPLKQDVLNGLKKCFKTGALLLLLGVVGLILLAMVGSLIIGATIFIAFLVGLFGFLGSFGRR